MFRELAKDNTAKFLLGVIAFCLVTSTVLLASCMSLRPPSNTANLCTIFDEKRVWYRHAMTAEKKWQIPVPVLMAVIYRESSFIHNARPPRKRVLFIIPWKRPSNAYGYAQALDKTWSDYVERTGNKNASRSNFRDSIDFVGWYLDGSVKQTGLKRWDAKNLYLTYHAGVTGYKSGAWRNNPRLEFIAEEVEQMASTYENQLRDCKKGPGQKYY